MAKQILLIKAARKKILSGVETLSKAVKVTLGQGRNVLLDKKFGAPSVTKDGVTVVEIDLSDPYENMGTQMVREVASRQQTLLVTVRQPPLCLRKLCHEH